MAKKKKWTMEVSKKLGWPGCFLLLIFCPVKRYPEASILLGFLSHGTSRTLKSGCRSASDSEDCSSKRSDERSIYATARYEPIRSKRLRAPKSQGKSLYGHDAGNRKRRVIKSCVMFQRPKCCDQQTRVQIKARKMCSAPGLFSISQVIPDL